MDLLLKDCDINAAALLSGKLQNVWLLLQKQRSPLGLSRPRVCLPSFFLKSEALVFYINKLSPKTCIQLSKKERFQVTLFFMKPGNKEGKALFLFILLLLIEHSRNSFLLFFPREMRPLSSLFVTLDFF